MEVSEKNRSRVKGLAQTPCLKKNRPRNGKGGIGIIAHYNCELPPSQPPFIAYNIAQYIFPTTPFIAIKYWQHLVRGPIRRRIHMYMYS